jgi:hypothetical protein
MIPNPPGGLINAASPLDPHSRPYVLLQQLWVGEAGTSKNSTSSSAGRHRDTAGITSLIPDAGWEAAAGSCFGVWILDFHWRSRVSWGPTCGPSHIAPLLEEAISGASRPAFIPWAGPTNLHRANGSAVPARTQRSLKNRGPGRLGCGQPRLPRLHRDRGRPTWGATASPHAQGPRLADQSGACLQAAGRSLHYPLALATSWTGGQRGGTPAPRPDT